MSITILHKITGKANPFYNHELKFNVQCNSTHLHTYRNQFLPSGRDLQEYVSLKSDFLDEVNMEA